MLTFVALLGLLWVAGHPGVGRLVGRSGWRRYLGAVRLGIVAFHGRRAPAVRMLSRPASASSSSVRQRVVLAGAAHRRGHPFVASLAFFPPTAVLTNFPSPVPGVREAVRPEFRRWGSATRPRSASNLLVYVVSDDQPPRTELAGLDHGGHPARRTGIRGLVVDTVNARGSGHLGSNLGVVELTIALHRAFASPHDIIAHPPSGLPHKLLTIAAGGLRPVA